jgi:hypothetical protein
VVAGADGVGGVLDHPQAVPLGDPVDLVQPPDQAGEVADHDGPGALADQLFQEVGVDGEVGSSMSQNTTSAPVAVIAWWAAT